MKQATSGGRAVYFPYLPRDVEIVKSDNREKTAITGAAVYASEVFKAILRHSTYDWIVLPAVSRPPGGDIRETRLFRDNAQRIRFVLDHELQSLRRFEQLVLFTPGPNIHNLIGTREASGGQAPIIGVIHSLNHATQLRAVAALLLSPVREHDAILCSSTAGHRAFSSMIRVAQCRLRTAGLSELQPFPRLPIIPLGINTAEFAQTPRDSCRADFGIATGDCVLLYVGRFGATTKADLFPLLLVLSRLIRLHPHARLVLAGDDTYQRLAADCRSFAEALGCAARVSVVPNPSSDEKKRLYAAADIFVSPADSLQETFGLSIIEAMASGLPVVASDWDGYRDIVEPEVTGLLIPTALPDYRGSFSYVRSTGSLNSVDLIAATTVVDLPSLERGLSRLIVNSEERERLGLHARARTLALFDWAVILRSYEALWDELARAAKRSDGATASAAPDLDTYDYVDVFAHYASRVIDPSERVRAAAGAPRMRKLPELLEKLTYPRSWFREAQFADVLSYCSGREDASIAEIVANCTLQDEEEARCLSAVFRLYKYGLLENVDSYHGDRRAAHS